MENIIIFGDWKFLMENCWKIVEVDNAVKLNKHPITIIPKWKFLRCILHIDKIIHYR